MMEAKAWQRVLSIVLSIDADIIRHSGGPTTYGRSRCPSTI